MSASQEKEDLARTCVSCYTVRDAFVLSSCSFLCSCFGTGYLLLFEYENPCHFSVRGSNRVQIPEHRRGAID
jgi:hypothetical protein